MPPSKPLRPHKVDRFLTFPLYYDAAVPITYAIDHERRVIFATWSGEIRLEDVEGYWRALMADPLALGLRRSVADLRSAQLAFRGVEFAQLIQTIALPALAGRRWHTAVIVDQPLQFGITRQYQALADAYSRDAIFDNPEDALKWLLAQGEPA